MIKQLIVIIFSLWISSSMAVWQGSGFFINQNGDIATARHMVEGKNNTIVVIYGKKYYLANIKVISKTDDIAIIHINVKNKYSFNLKPYYEHKLVFILGFPYTSHDKLVLTSGFLTMEQDFIGIINNSIVSCGGNSGGPVLDDKSNAIGILVSGYDIAAHCAVDSQAVPIKKLIDLAYSNQILVMSSENNNINEIENDEGVVEILEFINGK